MKTITLLTWQQLGFNCNGFLTIVVFSKRISVPVIVLVYLVYLELVSGSEILSIPETSVSGILQDY